MISLCSLCKLYKQTIREPGKEIPKEVLCWVVERLNKVVEELAPDYFVTFTVYQCRAFEKKPSMSCLIRTLQEGREG